MYIMLQLIYYQQFKYFMYICNVFNVAFVNLIIYFYKSYHHESFSFSSNYQDSYVTCI